jgi:hypothetical protein
MDRFIGHHSPITGRDSIVLKTSPHCHFEVILKPITIRSLVFWRLKHIDVASLCARFEKDAINIGAIQNHFVSHATPLREKWKFSSSKFVIRDR